MALNPILKKVFGSFRFLRRFGILKNSQIVFFETTFFLSNIGTGFTKIAKKHSFRCKSGYGNLKWLEPCIKFKKFCVLKHHKLSIFKNYQCSSSKMFWSDHNPFSIFWPTFVGLTLYVRYLIL